MSEVKEAGFIKQIIKGLLTSVIITLIGVLIFAFIVKIAVLNGSVIKAVNQFIKILSVFLGCLVSVRRNGGLIKGALVGLLFSVIIYLIFALFGGGISFGASFFLDLFFTSIIGAISGIISVNVKGSK